MYIPASEEGGKVLIFRYNLSQDPSDVNIVHMDRWGGRNLNIQQVQVFADISLSHLLQKGFYCGQSCRYNPAKTVVRIGHVGICGVGDVELALLTPGVSGNVETETM